MNKFSVFSSLNGRWIATISALLIVLASTTLFVSSIYASGGSRTVTVWLQAADSCTKALPGATFTVSGLGPDFNTGATSGNTALVIPVARKHAQCPLPQGKCANFSAGCVPVTLWVPGAGTFLYTITPVKLPPAQGQNVSFVPCNGGPACHKDAGGNVVKEVAFVTVFANSTVQAWIRNTEPDGFQDRWPATGFWNATATQPVLFHFSGVSSTSHGKGTCDGDGDADDFVTGRASAHCDNDSDKH